MKHKKQIFYYGASIIGAIVTAYYSLVFAHSDKILWGFPLSDYAGLMQNASMGFIFLGVIGGVLELAYHHGFKKIFGGK